jgi:hypothetical protein
MAENVSMAGVKDVREVYEGDLSDITFVKSVSVGHTRQSRWVLLRTDEFGLMGLSLDHAKALVEAIQREIRRMTT